MRVKIKGIYMGDDIEILGCLGGGLPSRSAFVLSLALLFLIAYL